MPIAIERGINRGRTTQPQGRIQSWGQPQELPNTKTAYQKWLERKQEVEAVGGYMSEYQDPVKIGMQQNIQQPLQQTQQLYQPTQQPLSQQFQQTQQPIQQPLQQGFQPQPIQQTQQPFQSTQQNSLADRYGINRQSNNYGNNQQLRQNIWQKYPNNTRTW